MNKREIKIGRNKIYLGEDHIQYCVAVGEIDAETAIAIRDVTIKLFYEVKGKSNILIDLNQAGKQSPKARKVFNELTRHDKAGKVAFFGLHPVAQIIACFTIGITKKKDMRFFKTREEALAWLKEK